MADQLLEPTNEAGKAARVAANNEPEDVGRDSSDRSLPDSCSNGESGDKENADGEDADDEGSNYGALYGEASGDDVYGDGESEYERCIFHPLVESDGDSYWDDSEDGSEDNDGNLSLSYRRHVSCAANGPFPLEELPPEIQLMIFRFAMPDDRTRPLYSRDYGDYKEIPTTAKPIPTSLFTANRSISSKAVGLLYDEVYFRMDVTPFRILCRHDSTRPLEYWCNHEILATWRPFECMRNYHLNIRSCAGSTISIPSWANLDNCDDGCDGIREGLRSICDQISANNIIRNLTITGPCKCARSAADFGPSNDTAVLDLFSPLKRVRLANPVKLSLHDDVKGQGIQQPCRKRGCLELAQKMQASIGRLEGEKLSEQEATWKEVKSLMHYNATTEEGRSYQKQYRLSDMPQSGIEEIWETLNGYGVTLYDTEEEELECTFEGAVQQFHERRAQREKERLENVNREANRVENIKARYQDKQKDKQQVEQEASP
ncbi:MAG: hypothetical protein L6R39_007236 [Caloplaca ligustica]|nr:MAG: hypothetical protein L6R39_007236 [Caloplaca ligustica]